MMFAMVSKSAEITVENCKGVIFVAIQERLDEFIDQNRRQVTEHGFK